MPAFCAAPSTTAVDSRCRSRVTYSGALTCTEFWNHMSPPEERQFSGPGPPACDVGGMTTGTTAVTVRLTAAAPGPVGFRVEPVAVSRHSYFHGAVGVERSGPASIPLQVTRLPAGAGQLPLPYAVCRAGSKVELPGNGPATPRS